MNGKGFTKVPNDLLEGLAKQPGIGNTARIYFAIVRWQLGFHNKAAGAEFSRRTLAKRTKLAERVVDAAMKRLIDIGLIQVVEPPRGRKPGLYRVNTELPQRPDVVRVVTSEAATIPARNLRPQDPPTSSSSAETCPQLSETCPQPANLRPQNPPTSSSSAETCPQLSETCPQPANLRPQNPPTMKESTQKNSFKEIEVGEDFLEILMRGSRFQEPPKRYQEWAKELAICGIKPQHFETTLAKVRSKKRNGEEIDDPRAYAVAMVKRSDNEPDEDLDAPTPPRRSGGVRELTPEELDEELNPTPVGLSRQDFLDQISGAWRVRYWKRQEQWLSETPYYSNAAAEPNQGDPP